MNAGQLAALIAAGFFAAGTCAGVYVLLRLAGLISAATRLMTAYQAEADELTRRARAAVDLADQQLARTGALADSVEQVSSSMSELSEQVSVVAGTARLIAAGLGTPVLRLAAAGHGVRHALALRRSRRAVAAGLAAGSGRAPGANAVAGLAARARHGRAAAGTDVLAELSVRPAAKPRQALRNRAGQ